MALRLRFAEAAVSSAVERAGKLVAEGNVISARRVVETVRGRFAGSIWAKVRGDQRTAEVTAKIEATLKSARDAAGGDGPTEGLVALWKFDETEGDAAADSSGNGARAELVGGPAWRPDGGAIGGALEFDGEDDCVDTGKKAPELFGGDFTISLWAKSLTHKHREFFYSAADGGSGRFYLRHGDGRECPEGGVKLGLRNWNPPIPGTRPRDEWVHYAVVFAGTSGRFYFNGDLKASKDDIGGSFPGSRTIKIGVNSDGKRDCLKGMVDDFRVYDRAISEAEILSLYALGAGGGKAAAGDTAAE